MNAAALHSAEILVRFANPPEDGKKPSIKASDGTYYGVKPADFGRFQPGGRYRIDYTQREYKGRTYKDIVKCEPIRSEPAPSGDTRPRAPSPSQRSVSEGEGVTPAEIGFVTRMLAADAQACRVGKTADDLVERGRMLRSVYRNVFA